MPKKTTTKVAKKVSKKASKKAEDAIKTLNIIDDKQMNDINNSIIDVNRYKLVEFVNRISNKDDFQMMLNLLIALQEKPQYMKRESDFETLYLVGKIDGQRQLVHDFLEICTYAKEGNIAYVQNKLDPIIIK